MSDGFYFLFRQLILYVVDGGVSLCFNETDDTTSIHVIQREGKNRATPNKFLVLRIFWIKLGESKRKF